ncbi:hypothetical protein EVAR_16952_1 [Eumeta japonica]|uniref:RNase H type-1 domain-containing protein n=1 Tax=Eumeta variegata TaxID=151549 RepID=A0A4C1TVH2_EUMVA|nr:hypothetical protein EVAR_16952_1 [Eumeta japonica]
MYCPSSVRTQASDWDELFTLFSNNTLICGDFNGHHSNWSSRSDSRGEQLSDSSLENGYILLNDGSDTRVKLVNGVLQKTSPDISFVSTDIAVRFEWQVMNENLGSDHLMIKLNTNIPKIDKNFRKRNFKKIDWTAFNGSLIASFDVNRIGDLNLLDASHVQEMYNYLLAQFKTAAEVSILLIRICKDPESKFKPQSYWNQSMSKAVAQRRLALSTFRRNPTPDNLTVLESKTREAYKLIRKANSSHWHNFCSSIDESTTASEMWRRMRWMKDGSKSREHQGAAFFDPSLKKTGSFIVKNKVCIMTLELIAISKALAYAETDNWDKIVICSDSKSAIQHLARCASGYRGVPTAFCVLAQLLQLKIRNVEVKLQWVPAHIGVYGNEEADKLANSAHLNGIEYPCCARGRPIIVEWERDARHSAGLSLVR